MIRRGQVQAQYVQELTPVLSGVEAVLENGQQTVEDERRLDAVRLHLVAVIDEVLNDGDEHRCLVVCPLTLGQFLTTGVLETG